MVLSPPGLGETTGRGHTLFLVVFRRGIDFLRGAWWPHPADLVREEVPFYRFTQKAGDVVFVNGGCVHWVQSTGLPPSQTRRE
jgi:hypothetical protein